jgi:hypothetical protein
MTIKDLIDDLRRGLRPHILPSDILLYNADKTRFLRATRRKDAATGSAYHRSNGTFWEITTGSVDATYTTDRHGVRHYDFFHKEDDITPTDYIWRGDGLHNGWRVEKKAEVLAAAARAGFKAE